MKPNYLFTSMVVIATIVATSCSVPKYAQQNTNDDVYNSVAQAKEYKVPVRESDYNDQSNDYGTSDPYYDMDYSSRINRFYNYSPWRSYYDPYFDSGWYGNYGLSLGFGFGYSPFYGSIWNSPYGWGNYYSPFGGYNNWGWNNYYGGSYYGGGWLGGGFYTGRTTIVTDYRARPDRGSSNGYIGRGGYGTSPTRASRIQSNTSNRVPNSTGTITRPSRGNSGTTTTPRPNTTESRPTRTTARPETRTQSPPSPAPAPSYSPPPRSSGSSGSGGGSSRPSSSGGGGARPSRGGR